MCVTPVFFTLKIMQAHLGLGSNLENPTAQLHAARIAIANVDGICEIAFSSLYSSAPMDGKNQPNYVNAVMAIETTLRPLELLTKMQGIENAQGRIREEHWGSRTLDIDILLFENEVLNFPELVVPHYGMTTRAFVLYPLFEIAPNLNIPTHGKLRNLLKNCPINDLKRLPDAT
jgi:2-amino-4-hydroxy-6-hydroxymethyldihydropteridine diphosphokinase